MSNYRRNRVPGGCYFFTVNILERKKSLLVDYIDELRQAIRYTKRKKPFHINAWVVLPDHMHCMWTLPNGDSDYSGRLSEIKKTFSKSIPKTEYLSNTRPRRNERSIWQHRFWEHTIRDEVDYQRPMDYLHYNPVKHGLVDTVQQWPFSTLHRLVEQGVYPQEWGNDVALNAGERQAMSMCHRSCRAAFLTRPTALITNQTSLTLIPLPVI